MIYYETGDCYKGILKGVKKVGHGFYYDRQASMSYTGSYLNDKKHGQGTLCSEGKTKKYIYDGSWYEGMRNGQG